MPQQALEPGAELCRGRAGGAGRELGGHVPLPMAPLPLKIPSPTVARPGPPKERGQGRRCSSHQLGMPFYCLCPRGQGMTKVVKVPKPGTTGTAVECNTTFPTHPPISAEKLGAEKAMGASWPLQH